MRDAEETRGNDAVSLTPEWKVDTSGTVDAFWYSQELNLLTVRNGEEIHLLSAINGTERGTVMTDGEMHSYQYAEQAGLLFWLTGNDIVHAIDPATGERKWDAQASSVGPASEDTVVLFAGQTLRAFRTRDGSLRWQATLPDEKRGSVSDIVDDIILISVGEYDDMGLVSYDLSSGDERWYYRPGEADTFQVTDDGLYVTLDNEIARVNGVTGTEEWSHSSDSHVRTIQIGDGVVYVRTSDPVVALNPTTGGIIWETEEFYDNEGLYVRDDGVYCCVEMDEFGDYYFLRLDTGMGRIRWKTKIEHEVRTLIGGESDLYLGTYSINVSELDGRGYAYRLNPTTGRIRWTFKNGDESARDADPGDPTLVRFGNNVFGINQESGQAEWSFANEYLRIDYAGDSRVLLHGEDEYFILDRTDGRVEESFETSSSLCVTGGDAVFIASGGSISAYSMTRSPEAFAGNGGRTDTEVFDAAGDGDGSSDSGTVVYESNGRDESSGDDGETAIYEPDSSDSGSTVSFCPNCGTDLEQYGAVSFCPECGTELPE